MEYGQNRRDGSIIELIDDRERGINRVTGRDVIGLCAVSCRSCAVACQLVPFFSSFFFSLSLSLSLCRRRGESGIPNRVSSVKPVNFGDEKNNPATN